VSIDEWMNALEPGDAWLRVAPVHRGWRQERVRVALPSRTQPSDTDSDTGPDTNASQFKRRVYPNKVDNVVVGAAEHVALPPRDDGLPSGDHGALPPVPPDCPPELLAMGADVLSQVERRRPKHHHELGPCLVWTGMQVQGRPYVWRRVYPDKPIRKGWTWTTCVA
jgi:hypothetical protein